MDGHISEESLIPVTVLDLWIGDVVDVGGDEARRELGLADDFADALKLFFLLSDKVEPLFL